MRTALLLLAAATWTTTLPGQSRPKLDIGIHAGATLLIPADGDIEYTLGVPGGGTIGGLLPPVYVTVFTGSNLMVETQVAFTYQSFSDGGFLNVALQLGYLMRPTARGSPYVAGHLLAANAYGNGNDSEFAAGASLGYRHTVKDVVAVRYEARYRRWFDADFSEIGLLIGVGVSIR